jgi:hypothetical protein
MGGLFSLPQDSEPAIFLNPFNTSANGSDTGNSHSGSWLRLCFCKIGELRRKWQVLMKPIQQISLWRSFKAVMTGISLASTHRIESASMVEEFYIPGEKEFRPFTNGGG